MIRDYDIFQETSCSAVGLVRDFPTTERAGRHLNLNSSRSPRPVPRFWPVPRFSPLPRFWSLAQRSRATGMQSSMSRCVLASNSRGRSRAEATRLGGSAAGNPRCHALLRTVASNPARG